MLRKLTIHNYALIESLDIDFPGGLVIITGETGAGKSILLGALSLLLGGKSDIASLKDNTRNCVVEGEFDISGCDIDLSEISGDDAPVADDNILVLRRVVAPSGRSRAFINDEPVPMSVLSEISRKLVDIHAQHNHLLLTDKKYQLSVLDYFAEAGELLAGYREIHGELQRAQQELQRIEKANTANAQEREYKEFQLARLQEANLVEGELEELELEQKQLANAEDIRSSVYGSLELLRPMGGSVVQNFKEAVHLLRKCYTFVPGLEEVAQRLESCRIECKDIEQELERIGDGITASPQRLQEVDERIALLEDLLKRYSCTTVSQLIEYRERLKMELSGAEESVELEESQRELVLKLTQERAAAADLLSERRRGSAGKLSELLEDSIRNLEMPYAEFKVELDTLDSYGEDGKDGIRFLFAANGGSKLVEISKVASGGELSRIMLCLKEMMAKYTGMPTMIFDEIDTGVSGSIADKMGEMIGRMGKNMQVFAITHLPQIAVKGETHLLVYKEFDSEKQAHTNIKLLEGNERVMEVARMLSGAQLSEAAIENAKYLLSNN